MFKKFRILFLVLIFLIISFFIIDIIFYNPSIVKREVEKQEMIDELQSKLIKLEDDLKNNTNEKKILSQKINNLQGILKINRDLLDEQARITNNKDDWRFKQNNNIFPIYTENIIDGNREILFYTSQAKEFPLEQQLDLIAYKLSQYCFEGLPIVFIEIKELENKKIAVFNLREQENDEDRSWETIYFNEVNGVVTSTELRETFLQRDYRGKWVDGVELLYENNKIDFEYMINLSDINYR